MTDPGRLRKKQIRGTRYSLEQFQVRYDLPADTAEKLFRRFGPGSVDLDVLMAAKGIPVRPAAAQDNNTQLSHADRQHL